MVPITDYSAGIWVYLKSVGEEKRFYVGVHKKCKFWQFRGISVGPGLKLDINFLNSHVE